VYTPVILLYPLILSVHSSETVIPPSYLVYTPVILLYPLMLTHYTTSMMIEQIRHKEGTVLQ